MPTLSTMNIPTPKSWIEFENIVKSSLEIKWDSRDLTKNGRQGQTQEGIDIYGHDYLGQLVGIQCKNTNAQITEKIILKEIEIAENFLPEIKVLYIATSASSDSNLQKFTRLLSAKRFNDKKFPVGLFFWEDLISELIKNPKIFNIHYPSMPIGSSPTYESQDSSLLSILAISYFGLHIKSFIDLIFGELGVLTNEDPKQINILSMEIINSAQYVFDNKTLKSLENNIDTLKSQCLLNVKDEYENSKRWKKVGNVEKEIVNTIKTLEHKFAGKQLAVFSLGKMLGFYNNHTGSNSKIKSDKKEIMDCFKAITTDPNDIVFVENKIDEYMKAESSEVIYVPNDLYNYARKICRRILISL